MRWSFKFARILGIDVKVHLTFLLLLTFYAFVFYRNGGPSAAFFGVLLVLLVFLCVLLHEFGHALAARRYGIGTTDITLLPIGGVARLERMPEDPGQEIVVALAGPAVNLVIMLGLGLALGFGAMWQRPALDDDAMVGALGLPIALFQINKALLLFNLIPAFPMDGGRVLRALLAFRLGHGRATQIAANIGQVFAVAFGLAGLGWLKLPFVTGSPILVLIAFFIFMAASQEATAAQMRDVTRNVRLGEALITDFRVLPVTATLADAVEVLLRGSQHDFPVVDAGGQPVGVLTRQDLVAALGRDGPATSVAEVMRRDVPSISVHAPFEEAFRLMQTSGCPALPVLDRAGRLVGLITPENVGEMMMIHSVLGRGAQPAWRRQ